MFACFVVDCSFFIGGLSEHEFVGSLRDVFAWGCSCSGRALLFATEGCHRVRFTGYGRRDILFCRPLGLRTVQTLAGCLLDTSLHFLL